ncbi:MAG: hypothetical protein LBE36_07595 [Flavobacteriaceae bacterium]|nr:hypothetical protein [Flavobacteriaceae bacterium]
MGVERNYERHLLSDEKRWIVERTISWTLNNRRCSKDYERKQRLQMLSSL